MSLKRTTMTSYPVMSRLTPELPLCIKFICLSKAMVDYKSTISVWLMASVKLKSHEFRWALGTTTRRTSHARFPWSSSALWCAVQIRMAAAAGLLANVCALASRIGLAAGGAVGTWRSRGLQKQVMWRNERRFIPCWSSLKQHI